MNKHILVTISDEPSCFYGVRFITSFFNNKKDLHMTLLYVAPPLKNSRNSSSDNLSQGAEALKMAIDLLQLSGFPSNNITTKVVEKQFGTVQDIIREGHKGLYDAVVLGRRGYLAFEGLLGTSTSRELMESRIDFPIWICKHGTYEKKHILIATDGSDASLRIADHVGFMLKDESHSISVCHVGILSPQSEKILEETVQQLVVNGISRERIAVEIINGRSVVDTLLDKMKKEHISVMAIGRSKAKEGTLKGWFSGSCSSKLLSNLDTGTLWVSK